MFRVSESRVAVVVVLFLLSVTTVLAGSSGTTSATTTDTSSHGAPAASALAAARDLADALPGTDAIGRDLIAELGYTPKLERSLAAKETGDCSSPVPLPRSFESACRVHDLGYDLLRVAHRHHTPIPDGLRADLDDLLGRQMLRSCDGRSACMVMARIAHAAVRVNTVRQGHGAPVEEALPW